MEELKIIQKYEPVFIEAAKLAQSLRSKAEISNKFDSGVAEIDIVTSADLEVQEFILKHLAEDKELLKCEMVAEEDTPSKKLFAEKSDLVITVDPIDGTKFYADGKKMYKTIITLHNKKRPLYTFDYFPEYDFGVRIVNDDISYIGNPPKVTQKDKNKLITYIKTELKNPQERMPEAYKKMIDDGYKFINNKILDENTGATTQFLLGIADGLYVDNGSAVDCLVGLHFALANNYKIIRNIDIGHPVKSSQGGSEEYSGCYIAYR